MEHPSDIALRFYLIPLLAFSAGAILSGFSKEHRLRTPLSGSCEPHAAISLVAMMVLYAALLGGLKYLKLSTLHFGYFDTAIYDSKLWRIHSAGVTEKFKIAFSDGHFQPVTLFYSLFYHLTPSPLLSFLLETIALSSGAIPIFLLTREKTQNPKLSLITSSTYLLYPAVSFNDINGFHPDHIYLPALLWAFYCYEKKQKKRFIAAILVSCCAGEQWMLSTLFFGIYILSARKKPSWGGAIALFSGGLFLSLMFLSSGFLDSVYGYQKLVRSGHYESLLTLNAEGIIRSLADRKKLFFILFLSCSFFGTPLFSPSILIVLIPDSAKTLLSSEPFHHAVDSHYTLGITAVLFSTHIETLQKIRETYGIHVAHSTGILVFFLTLGFHAANGPTPLSVNFWKREGPMEAYHIKNYIRDERTRILETIEKLIPSDPELKIHVSDEIYTPKIVHRSTLVQVFPTVSWKDADYIIVRKDPGAFSGTLKDAERYRALFQHEYRKLKSCNQFKTIWDKNGITVHYRGQKQVQGQSLFSSGGSQKNMAGSQGSLPPPSSDASHADQFRQHVQLSVPDDSCKEPLSR